MDFKTYLRRQGLSKSTLESYQYHVLNFLAFLEKDRTEPENCTEKEIMAYLATLQRKGLDNATKKLRLYALKHFFNYQVEHNKRDNNPAKKVKIRGTQKQHLYPILSPQELQALYEQYAVPKENDPKSHYNWFMPYRISRERNRVIIGLLAFQGITTAEAARIQLENVDLRKGTIHIRGGRVGCERDLELKPGQIMDFMEYLYKTRPLLLQYHKEPGSQLFLSVPGAGATHAAGNGKLQIWKGLTRELKTINPKLINLQQLRASVITHWLKQYNLRQVQYRAGHKHVLSTEAYLINDIDSLQQDIDSYHPII